MQMKRWTLLIAATVILTIVIHVVTVIAIPYGISALGLKKIQAKYNYKINILYHPPPVNSENKFVPFPNPDSLYSFCAYDVSDRPLRISANIPDSYWSLSLYEKNMDNYFVINDKQIKTRQAEIILTGMNNAISDQGSTKIVISPTETGFLFIRLLIEDSDKLDELRNIQKQAKCYEMK
jgi:uncharacterized membrane protein